ncbi:MAG: hypothetical protein AAF604_22475 [Acidobacteriota bacterium]
MDRDTTFNPELFEDPTPDPKDACESAGSCYPTDENETEMIPGTEEPRRAGEARFSLRRVAGKLFQPWFLEECESAGSCYPTDENESESVPKPGDGGAGDGDERPGVGRPTIELGPRPLPVFA